MGLFDGFRAGLEIRAERQRLEEVRESIGYTEHIIANMLAVAQGTYSPDVSQTAAVEFAAGLIGRALAVAIVEPESAAQLLTPLRMMQMGRRLVLSGNYVAPIEIVRRDIALRTSRHFSIVGGGIDESSWLYEIELAAPFHIETRRVLSPGVFHVRIAPDIREPWYGTSPLLAAGISADLLARVEAKTSEELKSPVGSVLPVPEGMGDDNKKAMQTDLGKIAGGTMLVETQAGGHGQGRQYAPQLEWTPKRIGAMIPESHVTLRSDVARDVCAALGIPPALYAGSDGGSLREGYRQLLTSTLEPLAEIIAAEFREKVGYPVTLNFRRLAAADIAARARAYGTLVAGGVDRDEAAAVAGLDL